MLTVSAYVNKTGIAQIIAWNISDLADLSDYGYVVITQPMGGGPLEAHHGTIHGHDRGEDVWALVVKILKEAGYS